jgi:hypothetical protein
MIYTEIMHITFRVLGYYLIFSVFLFFLSLMFDNPLRFNSMFWSLANLGLIYYSYILFALVNIFFAAKKKPLQDNLFTGLIYFGCIIAVFTFSKLFE